LAVIPAQTIKFDSFKDVVVRSAQSEDAGAIIEYTKMVLVDSDWSCTQSHEFDLTTEQEVEWIEDHRNSPGKLVIIALSGSDIVGLVDFANGSRERNRHVGVLGISVRKDWRRLGLGEVMLQILLDWAKVNPIIEKVTLAVFCTNKPAIGLYQKMGFSEEGRRIGEFKLSQEKYVDDLLLYINTKQA
jgi:RimJ/RimL family protein N-acetyltransferase